MEELQTSAEKTGYTAGHKAGLLLASKSGIHLGSLTGLDMYTRISFYKTLASILLPKTTTSPKVSNILESILKLCDSFPERNDLGVDMVGILRDVEGRWKMVRKLWRLEGGREVPLYGERRERENVGKTPVDLDF
jgi:hypothetical protein